MGSLVRFNLIRIMGKLGTILLVCEFLVIFWTLLVHWLLCILSHFPTISQSHQWMVDVNTYAQWCISIFLVVWSLVVWILAFFLFYYPAGLSVVPFHIVTLRIICYIISLPIWKLDSLTSWVYHILCTSPASFRKGPKENDLLSLILCMVFCLRKVTNIFVLASLRASTVADMGAQWIFQISWK